MYKDMGERMIVQLKMNVTKIIFNILYIDDWKEFLADVFQVSHIKYQKMVGKWKIT